jgi:thiol:disulfide interchange protein DsbC
MIPRALAGLLAALFVAAAHAGNSDTEAVKKAVEAALGQGTKVDAVRDAGALGLYEVQIGGDIIYTDRKASYLVIGDLVDAKSHRNLTEERKDKLAQVKFSDLPFDLAVKQVRGNGKRVFATFEDPNCGYCKKLAHEMKGMTDVTIYTFLYPILAADSGEKSRAIWCAPDRAKAWTDWMVGGTLPPAPAAKCDAPSDKVVALGRKLNVRGTPTLFFTDGSRLPGYVPVAQIEKSLDKAASAN